MSDSFYKNRRLFTITLMLSGIFLYSQDQGSFKIKNFTKQEYNAEMQNWSITHDQNGYIYVANNIGLLEFDGIEWTFYPAPNGTVIRAVAVDSENRIFTSGYREIGYWTRDSYGQLIYHSLNSIAEKLYSQNEEFWNIVIAEGKVYFHSFTSVFIYDYKDFIFVRPGGLISSINEIRDSVYLHIYDKGLFKLEDTLLTPIISTPLVNQNMVQFIIPYHTSGILLGTMADGIFLYEDHTLTPFLPEWKDYFIKNTINRGTVSAKGKIIIGTLLDGILIFNDSGELLNRINRTNGLQNNTVLGLNISEYGNLWVSLDQGVDFINFNVDPSYKIFKHEEVGGVYAAALHKGYLYLCTNLGVFYRPEKDVGKSFQFMEGTQGQAWDCKIFDDQLLVGQNTGTFILEGDKARRISDISGGMDLIQYPGNMTLLAQSSYTNIVFYSETNSEWEFKNSVSGFRELIRYIEVDHLHHIWAGHMRRGIYKLLCGPDNDTIISSSYYGDETFGQGHDIQVFKVENRIVFTTGKEMYTYDDLSDSIVLYDLYNTSLGEFSSSHRIVYGPDHHYWFISKKGIALYRIFENTFEQIKVYPADLFRDHIIIGYENIFPIDNYTAILCLDNGYAVLYADREDLSKNIVNNTLEIKAIGYKGMKGPNESLPVNDTMIHLSYNKNSLYLKLAFPGPPFQELGFQSYIQGIDDEWSRSSEIPEFSFERIPPGTYEISIRATNKWNKSSIVKKLKLKVSYPWYRSGMSFFVYGLLLLVAIITARYYLIMRIKIRERNIRNGKEKELIRLRNEKLNAELSFRSQELANSTMAIINKNEFLLKLKEILLRQKEELGTRYPDKYYREIIGRIDKNVSSMDDWKVFEFHFEKAHEKFLQKLMHKYPDLTHGDLRLCAYLRMNLSTKEIAPLLRISIRGVENHRYKLRKKLQLSTDDNLTEFIMAF